MNSFVRSCVVVVAGEEAGYRLAHRLSRMALADVRIVASLEDARRLCEAACVDACLVVVPGARPDDATAINIEADAPGCGAGIPSLLVAEVVTPHVARTARNSGYVAATAAGVPPRMLYRHLGALLQKSRLQRSRRAAGGGRNVRRRPRGQAERPGAGTRRQNGNPTLQ